MAFLAMSGPFYPLLFLKTRPLLTGWAEYVIRGGMAVRVLVGTCSWTDTTLLKSGWYPQGVKTPEERLQFYAGHFPIVEVDSSYYALPAERAVRLWVERTPPAFVFNIKAFSLFTRHPTRPRVLPKDLREALPAKQERNVTWSIDVRSWLK